jgi:citronellol/citronellal dehydrogenase
MGANVPVSPGLPPYTLSARMEAPGSRIFAPGLLDGQVCVVSGGGSGLGRASALELARLGAAVVVCGRRPEPLEAVVGAITSRGGHAEAVPMDIRDDEAVDALFDVVLDRHGRLDLLLNNAGGQFLSPAEAISPKGFRTVIELNVTGTWLMTHAAATKAFIPQERGKVISITISPHNGMPGMVHSGAARAAVENMMRTLSVEWARFGVRLCAIAAGQFDTETLRTKYPAQVVESIPRTVPLGRLGTEEEMAWLVAYLASPAGDFFSGSAITLDGARDNWFGPWPPGVYGEAGEPPAEERRER